ncbi:3-deoxy-7-phosphoheptulonate synthase class II [Haloechinothrix halophila]|uniref:3-deoxy-7-phosphoheptulonate synthase class II n=1 Tax=Haloechinothrix halophila TaxID=1069073 RepID=UPI00041F63DF|nr:3-deoxy-7-phosphoheptulonate synthase class II [Haloechinothrix halophila]
MSHAAIDVAVHHPAAGWHPDSWRDFPAAQQPDWSDPGAVDAVLRELAGLPPLVVPGEVRRLQSALAEVARGEAFLLQAGDCAELFSSCTEREVRGTFQVIQQLAVLLSYGAGLPVVTLGRTAGQFGTTSTPDASRLRTAYYHAATTLNLLRAMATAGPPELSDIHALNQRFVRLSPARRQFERVIDEITMALRFMAARRVEPDAAYGGEQGCYTSHEALLPGYERALVQCDPDTGAWYCGSAHLVWVDDRTRQVDGAHVELLSGIANPIGVKLGPSVTPDELRRLCDRLDPWRVPGRLVLITRMGAERVTEHLPPLLDGVAAAGHLPVWACDPMHGNPLLSEGGYKTRRFDDITAEVSGFLEVHEECGTHPGGLHLELTSDEHATERVGGADQVLDAQLARAYETASDLRLNADQAVELAFRVIAEVRRRHHPWTWVDTPLDIPRPRLRPAA